MTKRGSTSCLATKIAPSGLITVKALECVLELEKEGLRLQHHISVLSKRNHGLEKRVEELVGEGGKEGKEEVAMPGRGVADEEEVTEGLAVVKAPLGLRGLVEGSSRVASRVLLPIVE